MEFHLTNLQFFVGGFALILVFAFAMLLAKRRKKTPPFRNYFCSEYGNGSPEQESFSKPNEWIAQIQEGRRPFTPARKD